MNQIFKLRRKWFAGLLFRLFVASVLGFFCDCLLSCVGIGYYIFPGLMTIILIGGYTWAIHFYSPFFQSYTKRQRLLISTGMAFIPLFIVYGSSLFLLEQFFDSMQRAQFASPANPLNQASFYDGGFMDRDLLLYVKSDGQKPKFVAKLWWDPECYFSEAQWTKDGKMIVCSLNVNTASNQPIMAVAFDFSANKSMVPPWMTNFLSEEKPESDWRRQESDIKEMIATHGGLSGSRITDDVLIANEKTLWFWQKPP
ncbi:MAG TPA: hypothetical protein VK742_05650 [Candidatus Sulfotelmatobacter sp.]|jgi:hypothetical protein|nr:hypothetical protein [Candidatus Sulfotelmatobacter sp.]